MAGIPNRNAGTLLMPEIGADGLARESPVIAYTEKVIEAEQLQLRKYIEENYTKIRDVEKELGNLSMEMKLTSGPKKAALEHMRKKIEASTERIHIAKLKEDEAKKAWEAAAKVVKDEEVTKQKLCEDLNSLVDTFSHTVTESSNFQLSRLEELKRRLEAMNPSRSSTSSPAMVSQTPADASISQDSSVPSTSEEASATTGNVTKEAKPVNSSVRGQIQQPSVNGEGTGKKRSNLQGKGRGLGALARGRGPDEPGWTGAGFNVDGRG